MSERNVFLKFALKTIGGIVLTIIILIILVFIYFAFFSKMC